MGDALQVSQGAGGKGLRSGKLPRRTAGAARRGGSVQGAGGGQAGLRRTLLCAYSRPTASMASIGATNASFSATVSLSRHMAW